MIQVLNKHLEEPRHSDGMVIMYADRIKKSMEKNLKKQIEEEKNK